MVFNLVDKGPVNNWDIWQQYFFWTGLIIIIFIINKSEFNLLLLWLLMKPGEGGVGI